MYFKIKKADDQVIYVSLDQPSCNKWHIIFDENDVYESIRCFASRRQPKCKNCWLADTIERRRKRKISRNKNRI